MRWPTEPENPLTEQGDLLTTKHASAPATDTANLAEAVHADAPVPEAPLAELIVANSPDAHNAASTADASSDSAPSSESAPSNEADDLRRQIDALSLTQALLDFEMANARVLDLTARLVEANGRVLGLQAEADAARRATDDVRASLAARDAELVALRSSRSYKLAERIQMLLRAVRG